VKLVSPENGRTPHQTPKLAVDTSLTEALRYIRQAYKKLKSLDSLYVQVSRERLRLAWLLGDALHRVQDKGVRNFKQWVRPNCGFTYRTARNYIRVREAYPSLGSLREETLVSAYLHLGIKQPTRATEPSWLEEGDAPSLRYTNPPPISVRRNNYHDKDASRWNVSTPPSVAGFIHRLINNRRFRRVLDPAIGKGALVKPWRSRDRTIMGVDINVYGKRVSKPFVQGRFEDIERWDHLQPDLILCNPPFNSDGQRLMYPEVFLRKIVELFGRRIPTVLFVPMGFRLNQRQDSDRWHWLRETVEISSILTLPLDIFTDVEFHNEVLFFNFPRLKPHYFLPADDS